MTTLRCTRKILKRLGITPPATEQRSDGALGDWYANVLNVGRMRLVLCVSERTLLPVILPARELKTLPERLPLAVGVALRGLGVPSAIEEAVVRGMHPVHIGETRSRVVLGSMTEMSNEASFLLGDPSGRLTPEQASFRLCDMMCGPIDNSTPAEATLRLLQGDGGS